MMARSSFKVWVDNVEGEPKRWITLEEAIEDGYVMVCGNSLVEVSECCQIIEYTERTEQLIKVRGMDKCIRDKGCCEILPDNEVEKLCIEEPCMEEIKLKPCPFCGGETKIAVCDSEGNLHDDDYEQNPWSGLGYQLIHTIEENEGCPIAKYDCDGAEMGVYIYGSKAEAIEAWNRRDT